MPKNKLRPGGCTLVALCLVCCAAARGDSMTASQRELREREIANRTETERARLQRNFKTFRELSTDEQSKLRQLDLALREDARDQGSLRSIMNIYYDWLASLTVGQQQELRLERDPTRREMLVREFLKEQQEQALAAGSARGGRFTRLSTEDLAAALGVIERVMREKQMFSSDELEQLKNKKGVARHAYLIELAYRREPGGGRPGRSWSSADALEAVLESISNETQRGHILEGRDLLERGIRLYWALLGGFGAEYEKKKPAREDLERFFVQLKPHEQDEIMRLPYDRQQQQLTRMYMTRKSIEDPDNYPRPPQVPNWMRGSRAGGRGPGPMRAGDDQRPPIRGAGKKNDGSSRKIQQRKPPGDAVPPE